MLTHSADRHLVLSQSRCDTPENAPAHELLRELVATVPDNRPGTGDQVADAVVFLASAQAAHIQGVVLPVDGGFLAAR